MCRTSRCGIRIAQKATQIFGIIEGRSIDIGIVTAAHHLIIDNHLTLKINRHLSWYNDTTHVTTAKERAELGGIRYIVIRITTPGTFKQYGGLYLHGTAFHVFGKDISVVFQFHGIEFRVITSEVSTSQGTQHAFTMTIGICLIGLDHVLTVVAEEHLIDDGV